ncbi:hypothetical protein Tco_1183561 [Tanacetum coccineum]
MFCDVEMDGITVSAWFDQWCHVGPLSHIVTTRDIFRDRFNLSTKLKELISNGVWTWPNEWNAKYHFLEALNTPVLLGTPNSLEWREVLGVVKPFIVTTVWESIRHNMMLFLGIMLFGSPIVSLDLAMSCPLCESQPDSHEHVLFECLFSTQVWDIMKGLAGLSNVAGRYMDIVDFLIPYAHKRSCKSVIAKLFLSTSAYYLWQERNARLFAMQKRTVVQVVDVIKSYVRLKLLSCSFKKSNDSMELMHLWKLPDIV